MDDVKKHVDEREGSVKELPRRRFPYITPTSISTHALFLVSQPGCRKKGA